MLMQIIVLSISLILTATACVIGLIKVVPEVNKICDDVKKAADDSRD